VCVNRKGEGVHVTGKNEGARGGFILLKWLTPGDLVDQTNRIHYSFSDKMKNTSFFVHGKH
jgi:hypothetical protein